MKGTCWYIEWRNKDNCGRGQFEENHQETNVVEKKEKLGKKKFYTRSETKLNNSWIVYFSEMNFTEELQTYLYSFEANKIGKE